MFFPLVHNREITTQLREKYIFHVGNSSPINPVCTSGTDYMLQCNILLEFYTENVSIINGMVCAVPKYILNHFS